MTVYLCTLGIVLVCGCVIKDRKAFLAIASAPIFVLIAFRDANVGLDYENYKKAFEYIATLNFDELVKRLHLLKHATLTWEYKMESGWVVFNWIIAKCGFNFRMLLIIYALVEVISVDIFIYKYSAKPWLSLFLFITIGTFEISFCYLRQVMAMVILLWAYPFIIKKNYVRSIVIFFLAFTFHKTAILAFPLLVLVNVRLSKQRLIMIILGEIVLTFLSPGIFNEIIYPILKEMRYVSYAYEGWKINNLYILMILMALLMIIFVHDSFFYSLQNRTLCWGFIIAMIAEIIGLCNGVVARSIYIVYIYMINLLPNMLFVWQDDNYITNDRLVSKKNGMILTMCMIVFMCVFFVYKLQKYNNLVPYVFSFR